MRLFGLGGPRLSAGALRDERAGPGGVRWGGGVAGGGPGGGGGS